MQIILLGTWDNPTLVMPPGLQGYLLFLLYLVVMLPLLFTLRGDRRSFRGRELALFVLLALTTSLFSNAVKLRFSKLWLPPAPGTPGDAPPLEVPVMALLLIGVTAARLGGLPATLVALGSGVVQTVFGTGQLLQVFETVGFGLVVGFLLTQDYAGRAGKALRQPVVAMSLASLAAWLLRVPILFVAASASPFYALNYAGSYSLASLSPRFWSGVSIGLILQLMFKTVPGLAPARQGRVIPPYQRSLQQRLLFALVPLMLLIILVLFYAVTVTGVRVSTEQVVAQVERDAGHAADWVPLLFAEGKSLLIRLASDEALRSPDGAVRQARLQQDISLPGFFSELVLLQGPSQVVDVYPPNIDRRLLPEEKLLLIPVRTSGSPIHSEVYHHASGRLFVSFMAPLDPANPDLGVLVGRVARALLSIGRVGLSRIPIR